MVQSRELCCCWIGKKLSCRVFEMVFNGDGGRLMAVKGASSIEALTIEVKTPHGSSERVGKHPLAMVVDLEIHDLIEKERRHRDPRQRPHQQVLRRLAQKPYYGVYEFIDEIKNLCYSCALLWFPSQLHCKHRRPQPPRSHHEPRSPLRRTPHRLLYLWREEDLHNLHLWVSF